MKRVGPVIATAAGTHVACFILTLWGVEPVSTYFYSLAWWTYIIAVSAINSKKGRNSLLFDNPREFVWVFFFSSVVWFFFEVYNFRLNNWYYVDIPIEGYLRWPGYFVAYGTVLPGIFETATLLLNTGVAARISGPAMRVHSGLLIRLSAIGLLMMVAPLLNPGIFFPLVWVGLIFLLDPLIYRCGPREASFLGGAERGRYERPVRYLAAGAICGVLWEFWNFWAGSKWIYSIPHFDFLKVFEMPLLGFLGFPPFALECYLLYQALLMVRRRWLDGHPVRLAVALVAAGLFSAAAIRGIDRITIVTYKALTDGS